MSANPLAIYDRFDPAKNYDRHLFRADKVLQSAELNEVQRAMHARLAGIAGILMKEGSIISGAGIIVNHDTGATTCESGAIYVAGAVRGVPPAALVIATVGVVFVGVYLTRDVVTELEDPELLNPAVGTDGYKEPGAARERVQLAWGVQGSGQAGEFFPVWTVEDGWVRPKEAPPNIDAVTTAIKAYDVASTGGTYIVRGMELRMAADLPTGEQVYNLGEGAARINGAALELPSGRRVVFNALPDLQWIDSEPHLSTTEGAQRIEFDRWPMVGVPQVRIIKRRTVDVVHGGFVGQADPLPDNSVQQIELITQGGTTFNQPANYKLTAGQVDWSPSGPEPAPGSTYQVTYLYIAQVAATDVDTRGLTVTGAVAGTTVLLSYNFALRRIDRLTLSADGDIAWVRGVPAPWIPIAPQVPGNVLTIASVYQTWDAQRRVTLDGVRMVPMSEIADYRAMISRILLDQAELRLAVDISGRYSGIKKGLFADPMLSNAMRDAGQPQTALIAASALRLPITFTVHQIGTAIKTRQSPAYAHRAALSQLARTGSMLVNPYSAFDPLPRPVTLTPAVDRWTDVYDTWGLPTSVAINWFASTAGMDEAKVRSQTTSPLEYLRQIDVRFDLNFGPGETLQSVTFDGIVGLNGQYCTTRDGLDYRHPIDQADVKLITDWLETHADVVANYAESDYGYFNRTNAALERTWNSLGKTAPKIDVHDPRERIANHSTFQISPYVDETMEAEIASMCGNVRGVRWHPAFTDLIPADGGKAVGMQVMLEHFGWTKDNAIAFGDGGNDVAMLSAAGVGIAMGNACDEALNAADYVTASVDDDGIAKALAHLGVI